MAKAKVGRAQLLRMNAAVVEAEDELVALKEKRPVCDGCGRLKPEDQMTAAEKKTEARIEKAKVDLRNQRQAFREVDGR